MNGKPKYGTWLKRKQLFLFAGIALFLILLGAFLPIAWPWKIAVLLLASPFLYISAILALCYYQLSAFGGNYQSKIHAYLVESLAWDGRGMLLDIGAGSGSLVIKAAKRFPQGKFKAIDFWGGGWEYSRSLCEANAKAEHVDERIAFIKASASKLPFADETFDAAVSCLTFHEVMDEPDKRMVLAEAFRVLKKGGHFAFMDIIGDPTVFGEYNAFLDSLRQAGLSRLEAVTLHERLPLPLILRHKKVLGYAVLLIGQK